MKIWKFLKISQNIFLKLFCKKHQIFWGGKIFVFLGSFLLPGKKNLMTNQPYSAGPSAHKTGVFLCFALFVLFCFVLFFYLCCLIIHVVQILCLKGNWASITSSPDFFLKKVGVFVPLEVLACVMTACWVLHSGLTYFWRNMNISSIFYLSKSTSINTQHCSLWVTLKMMLFTKYLIKGKRIGRISWKFRCWFNLKSYVPGE